MRSHPAATGNSPATRRGMAVWRVARVERAAFNQRCGSGDHLLADARGLLEGERPVTPSGARR